ncbi:MAG TPA: hypothetical protein VFF95_18565 [Candidatus Binatus sp.]|jgi:hypothetical protein|nr:hypothetical protein [Candidatus Binatus sp.]
MSTTMLSIETNPEQFLAQRKRQMSALYVLWGTVIGEHLPTESQFYGWIDTFGVQITADAIKRTAAKARDRARRQDPMDARDLESYTTATARNMRQYRTA